MGLCACNKPNASKASDSNSDISQTARISAATTTAANNSLCTLIQPFYWEIGDANTTIAGASLGSGAPTSTTDLDIASASKLFYAAYAIEKRNGSLSAVEIKALNFTSGYSTFSSCIGQTTVGDCYTNVTGYSAANDGKFYYSGGHMQKLAAVELGQSARTKTTLASDLINTLGAELSFSYSIPQPAGGMQISADNYAVFLKKILRRSLKITNLLGTSSICTNTISCPTQSVSTPIPSSENWSYSLGHWVENDSLKGDGAFSSPGLYGFYPWISSDQKLYGILARYSIGATVYWDSIQCGRLIRKAYATGIVQ